MKRLTAFALACATLILLISVCTRHREPSPPEQPREAVLHRASTLSSFDPATDQLPILPKSDLKKGVWMHIPMDVFRAQEDEITISINGVPAHIKQIIGIDEGGIIALVQLDRETETTKPEKLPKKKSP